ncbi:hypothetical protein SAMN05428977_103456 [Nitrosomonas sp. Nm166]|nr:hypothetical protein [Nitrosomonas sp. Nm166]SFE88928.1 hypothetical protein SAMN05428977_103456 [Nitrosomonas sp. Nm166]
MGRIHDGRYTQALRHRIIDTIHSQDGPARACRGKRNGKMQHRDKTSTGVLQRIIVSPMPVQKVHSY